MPALVPDIGARSLTGSLRLRAVADGNAITRLVEIHRTAPMQVQRPLYLDAAHPGFATAHVINATAGLFAGDDLRLQIDVGIGARLAVSTPTMTRAYATPGGGAAKSFVGLRVHAGGYLEYAPAPTILCCDASLYQETHIDVAGDAHAAVSEVWAFGRAAHGEMHAFRQLDARSELHVGGTLVLADALRLRPGEDPPEAAVGGYAAYGTLALIGSGVGVPLLDRVRCELNSQGNNLGGASLLPREAGVSVRVLGASPTGVRTVLDRLIVAFRRYALGDESRRMQSNPPDQIRGGTT